MPYYLFSIYHSYQLIIDNLRSYYHSRSILSNFAKAANLNKYDFSFFYSKLFGNPTIFLLRKRLVHSWNMVEKSYMSFDFLHCHAELWIKNWHRLRKCRQWTAEPFISDLAMFFDRRLKKFTFRDPNPVLDGIIENK